MREAKHFKGEFTKYIAEIDAIYTEQKNLNCQEGMTCFVADILQHILAWCMTNKDNAAAGAWHNFVNNFNQQHRNKQTYVLTHLSREGKFKERDIENAKVITQATSGKNTGKRKLASFHANGSDNDGIWCDECQDQSSTYCTHCHSNNHVKKHCLVWKHEQKTGNSMPRGRGRGRCRGGFRGGGNSGNSGGGKGRGGGSYNNCGCGRGSENSGGYGCHRSDLNKGKQGSQAEPQQAQAAALQAAPEPQGPNPAPAPAVGRGRASVATGIRQLQPVPAFPSGGAFGGTSVGYTSEQAWAYASNPNARSYLSIEGITKDWILWMIVDSKANLMFVNSLGVLVNLRPSKTNVSTFGCQIRAEWDSDIDGYVELDN
eukprot:2407743-Rhodomonas_salina.1